MDSDVDELLVRDISRVVIAQVAPAENASFRVVSDAYFANTNRRRRRVMVVLGRWVGVRVK